MKILSGLLKPNLSMIQLMEEIKVSESLNDYKAEVSLGISSSVTINLLEIYIKKYSLISGIKVNVFQGNYDDPIGDLQRFLELKIDYVLLHPYLDNILPSFESQIENLSQEQLDGLMEQVLNKYKLVFKLAHSFKQVFFALFHPMNICSAGLQKSVAEKFSDEINDRLKSAALEHQNISFINIQGSIIQKIGANSTYDKRFYYKNKAPYTIHFMDEYGRLICQTSRFFNTKFYKALVLDCDNTLWGGVVGEDLLDKIKLSPFDYPGNVFWQVQNQLLSLERSGVILCLCSKNNLADVDEVLIKHPHCLLQEKNIVAKKVNWNDKASNLIELSGELNIGLDSMIFLDDSSFECELIKKQLPMVQVFQVPKEIYRYEEVMQQIKELFLMQGVTEESKSKTLQYKRKFEGDLYKAQFDDYEDYLKSLNLKVTLRKNAKECVSRISELSMKSNQFNLTTLRLNEAEIKGLLTKPEFNLYSIDVEDKFGPAGLTGVVLVRNSNEVAEVINFYMSCRVIGRGVEQSIWGAILSDSKSHGCNKFEAKYIETSKNELVRDFYERLGFDLVEQTNKEKSYRFDFNNSQFSTPEWIELIYD